MRFDDLSRAVSRALRHEPWLYELELDDEGWVSADALALALRHEKPEWSSLSQDDLVRMIAASEKKRHEIRQGRIRALYGHSVPTRLIKQPGQPPEILFHGTSPEAAARIVAGEGLKPMDRQWVHLSVGRETAKQVGRRKSDTPRILEVAAGRAFAEGVAFYRGNDEVWLADTVPAIFIR